MRIKRIGAMIGAVVMLAVMSVGTGFAASAGIQEKAADVTVDKTVVGFAGHEWWVIGDANGGIYKQNGSVTLLGKNNDFGQVEFRKSSNTKQGANWNKYSLDNMYYEGTFAHPTSYKDSTLQRKMEELAGNFPVRERGKINGRTLTAGDDAKYNITGGDVSRQKLWPISYNEYYAISNDDVRAYKDWFWFRSPFTYFSSLLGMVESNGNISNRPDIVDDNHALRPALSLNVQSAIFTSNAKGAGSKVSVTLGRGLVFVTNPATTGTNNKIKYTFKDDGLKLDTVYVSKIDNGTATVKYSGATAGKTLSVIVKNNSGAVTHYGKLAENITASGEASLQLPNGFNPAADKIEIFVEEINGENESDFASTPKELDMTVKNMVYVTNGTGGGLYAKGADVKLTANTPDNDKYFKGWNISPAVTLIEGTNTSGIIKFNMRDSDVNATAEYGTVYRVKNGQNSIWKQGSGDGLTFTSEGEVSKFTGVLGDGNTVDKVHYDYKSGSTVITLKSSYLSTLSLGEHTLRIEFNDGYSETKFTVEEAVEQPKVPETTVAPGETTAAPAEDTSPKTGDKNKLWLIGSVMVIAGVMLLIFNSKKQNI